MSDSGSFLGFQTGLQILKKRVDAVFLLVVLLPFFVSLDTSSVWDANEAFYVQTPREMVESGDWITPTFNGQPRLNKPPLSYWLVGILYKTFGSGILWERLLLALLGVSSVLILNRIGVLFYSGTVALLAAGFFATTFRFLIVSRRLMIDGLVLTLTLATAWMFLLWLKQKQPRHFVLAAFFAGLGVLAKGPVGLFPIPILLIFLILTRRLHILTEAPLFRSAVVFLTVSCSWFLLLGFTEGWEPVSRFFLSENLGRYLNEDFGPSRTIFYYVGVFLADFFSWSLLFVASAPLILKTVQSRRKSSEDPAFFLLIWVATYFLVFSLSRNKQEYYILPVYPMASLLLATYLEERPVSRYLKYLLSLGFVLLAPLVFWMGLQLFAETQFLWITPVLLILSAGLLASNQLRLFVLSFSLCFSAGFGIYSGPMERYKPVLPLANHIQQEIGRLPDSTSAKIGYFRLTAPSLRFYSDRNILEIYDEMEAVNLIQSDNPAYLITDEEGLLILQQHCSESLEIVESRPKLYTTARVFLRNLAEEEGKWTRKVYLVTNTAGG